MYTPTRTLTLYAPDLEAQRAWVAALRAAGEQVYDAEELKAKATALQEMAPLLLDQAQRQFKRMHQILASLKCTGYVVQEERVKSLKKGYLEFQRDLGVPSCRVTPLTRVHRTMTWVVSFSTLRPFGPS